MKKYVKLVNFEFNRFLKIYLVLMGLVIVLQMTGVIVISKRYLHLVKESVDQGGMSLKEFLEEYDVFSFADIVSSTWFEAPIMIGIVTLLIYVFFIWYRDWFAQNTFVYRLLMLPTARINLYWSKTTVIFLMVLGLVALQIVLIPVEQMIMQWMIPLDVRVDLALVDIIEVYSILPIVIPGTPLLFIKAYLIGFTAVFALTTIILFERSWHWKGIVIGILYGVMVLLIILLPQILQFPMIPFDLYPNEMYLLQLGMALLVSILSIGLGHWLLKHKITV